MKVMRLAIAAALTGAAAASATLSVAFAQQPASQPAQTIRLRGVIEKLDGRAVLAKSTKGEELKLNLVDKALVVAVVKASMAEIKPGLYIGSGAMPQPNGSQKALEVHIFAESMRGAGEGFRPWDGAPNSTMTNGTVGASVSSVDGPMVTVQYKDGEKQIIVGPNVPIVRYEIAERSVITSGAPFTAVATAKASDGSFDVSRINVGRGGASPP
jgi:hypothetical protein